jgi:hypothetical protein
MYNKTREAILAICHKQCELFKFEMRTANNDEVNLFLKCFCKFIWHLMCLFT